MIKVGNVFNLDPKTRTTQSLKVEPVTFARDISKNQDLSKLLVWEHNPTQVDSIHILKTTMKEFMPPENLELYAGFTNFPIEGGSVLGIYRSNDLRTSFGARRTFYTLLTHLRDRIRMDFLYDGERGQTFGNENLELDLSSDLRRSDAYPNTFFISEEYYSENAKDRFEEIKKSKLQ